VGFVGGIGQIEHRPDLLLRGAVENRGGKGHSAAQVVCQFEHLRIIERVDKRLLAVHVVDLGERVAQFAGACLLAQHVADAQANSLGSPSQVGLENLAHVHARRHAERIEHNVHRRAVRHERHVLHRHDARHHSLVAMPARHLVARLEPALDRQVDLDRLEHPRGKLVALGEFLALFLVGQIELVALLFHRLLEQLELGGGRLVFETDVEPVVALQMGEVFGTYLRTLGKLARTSVHCLAHQQPLDPRKAVVFHDAQLVVEIQAEALELIVDDRLRALVAGDAFAGEDLHIDHGAAHP